MNADGPIVAVGCRGSSEQTRFSISRVDRDGGVAPPITYGTAHRFRTTSTPRTAADRCSRVTWRLARAALGTAGWCARGRGGPRGVERVVRRAERRGSGSDVRVVLRRTAVSAGGYVAAAWSRGPRRVPIRSTPGVPTSLAASASTRKTDYTLRQLRYDLAKLRPRHGLAERSGASRRYRLTADQILESLQIYRERVSDTGH